jgi:hypothetical protein
MAFSALTERLEQVSNSLNNLMPDIISQAVMVELMAKHKQRVFDKGLDTDGQSLGEYSTASGYYSKDKFIRKAAFKGVGKVRKDGNQKKGNKTMFLAKGYSEFRDIQGRKTDHINLKYSGSLEAGINVVKIGNSTQYGTTDRIESKKFEGLEERYDVFGLSISEKEFLKNEITEQAIIVARKK